MTMIDIFEKIVVCLTPIILGVFSYRATNNEKRTKEFIEMQEKVEQTKKDLEQKEKLEVEKRFSTLEKDIASLNVRFEKLEEKTDNISMSIDKLIASSNTTFEFTKNLSNTMSLIGGALAKFDKCEAVDGFLDNHHKAEIEILGQHTKNIK